MSTAAVPAAWTACLDAFSRELTPQQFVTWIQPLACRHEGSSLRLTAPNRFVLQWVKERFGPRIVTLATSAIGSAVNVEYALADADRQPPPTAPVSAHQPVVTTAVSAPAPVDS